MEEARGQVWATEEDSFCQGGPQRSPQFLPWFSTVRAHGLLRRVGALCGSGEVLFYVVDERAELGIYLDELLELLEGGDHGGVVLPEAFADLGVGGIC